MTFLRPYIFYRCHFQGDVVGGREGGWVGGTGDGGQGRCFGASDARCRVFAHSGDDSRCTGLRLPWALYLVGRRKTSRRCKDGLECNKTVQGVEILLSIFGKFCRK